MNATTDETIRPEEIAELHITGFKLVPISENGVTPIIEWSQVYENGWNEDELKNVEFPNVATCFGKSQLKDEQNRELFLNCLDIDSEEVFNRLSIIVDKNGKEQFFIGELRRRTFVTKTRKKFGYHIYWFSHNLNIAVQGYQCKSNHEFEIKTDKRGLVSLPRSRHRDDPEYHYSKIGQNKIMVNDHMYDIILRLLDDCLVKRDFNNTNEYVSNEFYQLTENSINKICELISPIYGKGFRHQICYSIAGWLYKYGVGLESTSKIINYLARSDEETKIRLAVMRHTYSKAKFEVSGRIQLLTTLESACDDKSKANDIIRSILKILNNRADDKIRDQNLTKS